MEVKREVLETCCREALCSRASLAWPGLLHFTPTPTIDRALVSGHQPFPHFLISNSPPPPAVRRGNISSGRSSNHLHVQAFPHVQIANLVTHSVTTECGALHAGKRKLGANALKRVAAGAHLPTRWLFQPAKRPDDRTDHCLDCNFLPQCKNQEVA